MMKYAITAAAVVLFVSVGVLGAGQSVADDRETMCMVGQVTPMQWHDALGVYAQCWKVTAVVKYGGQVYDSWSGKTCEAGSFQPTLHRESGRKGAILEVTVSGGFLYNDDKVQVNLDEAQRCSDPGQPIDLGTIIMQRHC
jgi:hypothetical protein